VVSSRGPCPLYPNNTHPGEFTEMPVILPHVAVFV